MVTESLLLKGLKHKNINPILGLIEESETEISSVFSFCEIGNLKSYLSSVRAEESESGQEIMSMQEMLYLILQLLKAVNYLHSKNLIHKDIAARNCWLDENFQLKLADYALSRDVFPEDYHCLANNENRPVFWMSYESVVNGVFNAKTDIWSIGVFFWECFTLAKQPFENIDPFEYADFLVQSEENRLARPDKCSADLYAVCLKCWSLRPSERPSLKELFNSAHKFYNSGGNNANNHV